MLKEIWIYLILIECYYIMKYVFWKEIWNIYILIKVKYL